MAGIHKELWTGELLERLYERKDPYTKARNLSSLVASNETIHFGDLPTVPGFLIDPTFPIASTLLTPVDVPIGLKELATEVTYISDSEKRSSSIDLSAMHLAAHEEAIFTGTRRYASWNIAPQDNAIATIPFVKTTGADNGVNSMKKATKADFLAVRKAWNDQNIPAQGRVCLLTSQHESDLIASDPEFEKRMFAANGAPFNYMDFEVWTTGNLFKYNTNFTKPGAYNTAGDRDTSLFFHASCIGWAYGTITMYEALPEPLYHRTGLNFGGYFTAVRLRATTSTDIGVAVLVSDDI